MAPRAAPCPRVPTLHLVTPAAHPYDMAPGKPGVVPMPNAQLYASGGVLLPWRPGIAPLLRVPLPGALDASSSYSGPAPQCHGSPSKRQGVRALRWEAGKRCIFVPCRPRHGAPVSGRLGTASFQGWRRCLGVPAPCPNTSPKRPSVPLLCPNVARPTLRHCVSTPWRPSTARCRGARLMCPLPTVSGTLGDLRQRAPERLDAGASWHKGLPQSQEAVPGRPDTAPVIRRRLDATALKWSARAPVKAGREAQRRAGGQGAGAFCFSGGHGGVCTPDFPHRTLARTPGAGTPQAANASSLGRSARTPRHCDGVPRH